MKKKAKIEIGQLRLWTESVWKDKQFLVIERFTDFNQKMLKVLQNNRIIVVTESVAYRMSDVIEDS
jgi:hypothetical protein